MASEGRPLGSMVISLGLDSSQFEDSLKSIQNQFRIAQLEMKAHLSILDSTGNSYDKLRLKVDSLTKAMKENAQQIQQLKSDYDSAVKVKGEYSDAAQKVAVQLNNAERQQSIYSNQLKSTKVELKNVERGTSDYKETLDRTKREIQLNTSILTSQNVIMESNVTKYKYLGQEVQNYNNLIASEKAKLRELVSVKGRDSQETQEQRSKLSELSKQQSQASKEYESLGNQIKTVSTETSTSVDKANSFTNKVDSIGTKLKNAGKIATNQFTIPIASGLINATQSAIDFDSEMLQIGRLLTDNGKITSNVKKQMEDMANASKQWSQQYGISTSEINSGMEQLVKSGFTVQQTMGVMPSILDATKSSGSSFNDVMSFSTSIVEQFGLKSESTNKMLQNTQRVTDSLTYVSEKTSTNFQDMGDAMSYVAPAAHKAGVGLEEASAAIGLMSNQGIRGTDAGNSLKTALENMIQPSQQNEEGFRQLGINIEDFKNNSLPLPDLLDQVKNNTKGWTNEQKEAAMAMAVGADAQSGFNALVEQGGDALIDLTNETENARGVTKRAADEMSKSAGNSIDKFNESLNILAQSVGEVLMPVVTDIVKGLTNFINFLDRTPESFKKFAVFSLVAVSAIGPLIGIIGNIVKSVKFLIGIFGAIAGVISTPVALVVGAILAIGAAVVIAYNHFKPFRDFVNNIFEAVKDIISKAVEKIKAAFDFISGGKIDLKNILPDSAVSTIKNNIQTIKNNFKDMGKTIKDTFDSVVKTVKSILSPVVNFIKSTIKKIVDMWNDEGSGMKKTFEIVWGAISSVVTTSVSIISGIIKMFVNNISKSIKLGLEIVKSVFSTTFGNIKQIVNGVLKAIKGTFQIFSGVFTGNWKQVWTGVKNVFKGIWDSFVGIVTLPFNAMKGVMKGYVKWFKDTFKPLIDWAKGLWSSVSSTWHSVWDGIFNWFKEILNGIGSWFSNIMNSIAQIWNSIWTGISNFFRPILNSISDFISNVISAIKQIWDSTWGTIKNFFIDIWNAMVQFLTPIFKGIADFISQTLGTISDTWSSMWSSMSKFFGDIWDKIKGFAQDGINGVISVINAGVNAINTVWKFFSGKETGIKKLDPVKFEQGGIVTRHLSMINDGGGSDWKELVQLPSGQLMMSNERNWTGFLPEGTRIYSGSETKAIMNSVGIQKYANGGIVGSIKGVIDWGSEKLSDIGSWLGDKYEAIAKFLENPIENTKNLMKQAANSIMPNVEAFKDFASGALDKTSDQVGKWVKTNLQKIFDSIDDPGGSGVQRWRPHVKRALKMLGLSTSESMIARVLRQIKTESGGNPKALGGTDGYNEGRATGLMQVKPPTFNAFKLPGHGNIWNGFDNLLAGLNYAKHTYGPSLSFLGNGHGYALGGISFNEQIARISEGNRAEAIVPLTNRTRAMQVLSQIRDDYGLSVGTNMITDTRKIESNQQQQLTMMQSQNNLLSQIVQILLTKDQDNTDVNSSQLIQSLISLIDNQHLKQKNLRGWQLG